MVNDHSGMKYLFVITECSLYSSFIVHIVIFNISGFYGNYHLPINLAENVRSLFCKLWHNTEERNWEQTGTTPTTTTTATFGVSECRTTVRNDFTLTSIKAVKQIQFGRTSGNLVRSCSHLCGTQVINKLVVSLMSNQESQNSAFFEYVCFFQLQSEKEEKLLL